ncbi:MAG: ParB N-terminal domain-containing protein [Oscillospiraceae bacterium]|nr:ParB N-terminal domain-containing protein [Oscillospiraceae bacterium]
MRDKIQPARDTDAICGRLPRTLEADSVNMTNRLEIRPIAELRPYANNARIHTPEQIDRLRASLRTYGFVRPLLIDAEGTVLAGHGILEAAKAEGLTEAPCVPVEHLSEAEARAYILADNRLAELSAWDDELVSGELQALRDAGFGLYLTGFDAADLQLDDGAAEPPEITEDDFDPEPPEEPTVRRGQLWQLGDHRLMCGDAASLPDVQLCVGGGAACRHGIHGPALRHRHRRQEQAPRRGRGEKRAVQGQHRRRHAAGGGALRAA